MENNIVTQNYLLFRHAIESFVFYVSYIIHDLLIEKPEKYNKSPQSKCLQTANIFPFILNKLSQTNILLPCCLFKKTPFLLDTDQFVLFKWRESKCFIWNYKRERVTKTGKVLDSILLWFYNHVFIDDGMNVFWTNHIGLKATLFISNLYHFYK